METLLEDRNSEAGRKILAIMEEAEKQELRNGNVDMAMSGYRRVFEFRVPPVDCSAVIRQNRDCIETIDFPRIGSETPRP